jgi:hypothetical protein
VTGKIGKYSVGVLERADGRGARAVRRRPVQRAAAGRADDELLRLAPDAGDRRRLARRPPRHVRQSRLPRSWRFLRENALPSARTGTRRSPIGRGSSSGWPRGRT